LVFVFKNGRKAHRNNIQLGRHGRYRTNVWSMAGMNTFARATDDGVSLADHATIKPTQLIADILLDCTGRGDLVLDGMLGSGTTVIASERTGRVCYGIEIEPKYVDLTIRRWQRFTGQKARHAVSGSTFDAIAAKAARKGVHRG